jgi:hypothetical protein
MAEIDDIFEFAAIIAFVGMLWIWSGVATGAI